MTTSSKRSTTWTGANSWAARNEQPGSFQRLRGICFAVGISSRRTLTFPRLSGRVQRMWCRDSQCARIQYRLLAWKRGCVTSILSPTCRMDCSPMFCPFRSRSGPTWKYSKNIHRNPICVTISWTGSGLNLSTPSPSLQLYAKEGYDTVALCTDVALLCMSYFKVTIIFFFSAQQLPTQSQEPTTAKIRYGYRRFRVRRGCRSAHSHAEHREADRKLRTGTEIVQRLEGQSRSFGRQHRRSRQSDRKNFRMRFRRTSPPCPTAL